MLCYVVPTCCLLAFYPGNVLAQMAALPSATEFDAGADASVPVAPAAPTIYLTAQQMPVFPGGEVAMLKFLVSKLQYPAKALDHSISGKVHVTFTVDSQGHLRDPQVVKGIGYGLDEEALRLVRIMPWWTPGRIEGRPVWVRITMPIVFRAL